MLDVNTVATYLRRHQPDHAEPISNMKLQKLCYYAQGLSLARLQRPLFKGQIKAWEHGPFIPALWHKYKESWYYSIPIPQESPECPSEAKHTPDLVIRPTESSGHDTPCDDPRRGPLAGCARGRQQRGYHASIHARVLRPSLALIATEEKPRPVDKNKLRDLLLADGDLRESTRVGLEEIETGRFAEVA